MLNPLKNWIVKYDVWSLFSDFFFLLGVLFFNWNPVLLILWFMIDTGVMLVFTTIIFHKENNSWIYTVAFLTIVLVLVYFMTMFYGIIENLVRNLKLEDAIHTHPSQILNPVILPVLLCTSALTHYTPFKEDLERMKSGSYQSLFIRHFFLRYFLITGMIVVIVLSYVYFSVGAVVGLIGVKSALRLWKKKYRNIL